MAVECHLDNHCDGLHAKAEAAGLDPQVILNFINEFAKIAPTIVPVVTQVINGIIALLPHKTT